jgi:hypothetical protein
LGNQFFLVKRNIPGYVSTVIPWLTRRFSFAGAFDVFGQRFDAPKTRMGTIVIKPDPGEDFYVGWSSVVESPVR